MADLALLTAALMAAGLAVTAPAQPTPAPPDPAHVANPYAGAVGYRNPQWGARAAAEPGGSRVTDNPTAVWLDSIAAVDGLRGHLDVGNHARAGEPLAQLVADTVGGSAAGPAGVDGFITNTADYAPLREPFVTVDDETRQSRWINGNRYNEELPFALDLRARLVDLGFPAGVGMLIDTSRNGWGGPGRPTAPSADPDVDLRVDLSRIDRRAHKRNWCNQAGAGLGETPRADPGAGIDAYVWAKPPGESDGTGMPSPIRGFNPMCDPTYGGGIANDYHPSTALPNGPERGVWFPAQFRELLANAVS
jgi:cellulose 1,4-beta-cellobiosidase